MNALLHQIAQRGVDHALPLETTFAGKSVGHDDNIEMAAICGARMACMCCTVVVDIQMAGAARTAKRWRMLSLRLMLVKLYGRVLR